MGIAVSLILIAAGAILTWAVTDNSSSVNLDAVGVVLMVVGLIGLLVDLMLLSAWAPRRRRAVAAEPAPAAYSSRAVVEDRPAAPRRRIVEHEVVEEGVEEPGPPPPP